MSSCLKKHLFIKGGLSLSMNGVNDMRRRRYTVVRQSPDTSVKDQ